MTNSKTIIIGAGIVGLCTAWSLRRRGLEVEVYEARNVGQSASAVNAGWVTPSLSTPLASPGILSTGLRQAFQRDGALRIRPQLDLAWLRWLWQFQRASRPREYRAGVKALLDLNRNTIDLFDELRESGVVFEMHEAGLLALALKPGGLQWFDQLFAELIPMGFPGGIRHLSGDEARQIEPAVSDRVVVAAHTSIDRHVHPDSLLRGLVEWLRGEGVEIHESAPVSEIARDDQGWRVSSTRGQDRAANVVVALGARANDVLKTVGMKLPVLGAKGYSATVQLPVSPKHALYLMEAKLGASPFQDGLRIAGAFDLPSSDLRVRETRVRSIVDQARPYIAEWDEGTKADISSGRAGLRPATPNSLPFIGEAPGRPGLYVAVGHGMLGLTLAPATGEAIADLIAGALPAVSVRPFALEGRA